MAVVGALSCLIVHCLNAQISSSSERKIEEIIYLKDKKLKVR